MPTLGIYLDATSVDSSIHRSSETDGSVSVDSRLIPPLCSIDSSRNEGNTTNRSEENETYASPLTDVESSFETLDNYWIKVVQSNGRYTYKSPKWKKCFFPPKKFWNCVFNFPYGWEVALDESLEKIYFLDHNNKRCVSIYPFKDIDDELTIPNVASAEIKLKLNVTSSEELKIAFSHRYCNELVVENIPTKSKLASLLNNGDVIKLVNKIPVRCPEDFFSEIQSHLPSIQLTILRPSIDHNPKKEKQFKSSLMSLERKRKKLYHPMEVHFITTPRIIEDKMHVFQNPVSKMIEQNMSEAIVVHLDDDSMLTVMTSQFKTIGEITQHVIQKRQIKESKNYVFCLVDDLNGKIIYFDDEEPTQIIFTLKNFNDNLECRLTICYHPTVNGEKITKYMCDDALKNFYLKAFKSVKGGYAEKIVEMSTNEVAQLYAYIYLVEDIDETCIGIDKVLNRANVGNLPRSNPPTKQEIGLKPYAQHLEKNSFSVSYDIMKNFSYLVKYNRLSVIRSDVHFSLVWRQFVSNLSIYLSEEDRAILFILPSDLVYVEVDALIKASENLRNVSNKLKSSVWSVAVELGMVECSRFRVHIKTCSCAAFETSGRYAKFGRPATIFLGPFHGLGIITASGKYVQIAGLMDVTCVLITDCDSERKQVTLAVRNSPILTIILMLSEDAHSLNFLIKRMTCVPSSSTHTSLFPGKLNKILSLDMTRRINYVPTKDLPPYHQTRHLVIPSFWSGSMSALTDFTKTISSYLSLMTSTDTANKSLVDGDDPKFDQENQDSSFMSLSSFSTKLRENSLNRWKVSYVNGDEYYDLPHPVPDDFVDSYSPQNHIHRRYEYDRKFNGNCQQAIGSDEEFLQNGIKSQSTIFHDNCVLYNFTDHESILDGSDNVFLSSYTPIDNCYPSKIFTKNNVASCFKRDSLSGFVSSLLSNDSTAVTPRFLGDDSLENLQSDEPSPISFTSKNYRVSPHPNKTSRVVSESLSGKCKKLDFGSRSSKDKCEESLQFKSYQFMSIDSSPDNRIEIEETDLYTALRLEEIDAMRHKRCPSNACDYSESSSEQQLTGTTITNASTFQNGQLSKARSLFQRLIPSSKQKRRKSE